MGIFGSKVGKLIEAADDGVVDRVRKLLAKGVDPNAMHDGTTPLHSAVAGGHLEVVELLLDAGADPTLPDERGEGPLAMVGGGDALTIAQTLVAAGARPSADALCFVIFQGKTDVARLLLDHVDPNATAERRNTPLISACRSGALDIARDLLARGADPKLANEDGETPLAVLTSSAGGWAMQARMATLASQSSGQGIAGLGSLIQGAIDMGKEAEQQSSAELPDGTTELVNQLIERGADVNAADAQGTTALIHALRDRLPPDLIRRLLEAGANPDHRDQAGRTARGMAERHPNPAVRALFGFSSGA